MTRLFSIAIIAGMTCLPVLAEAQGNGNGRGGDAQNCPPGLAKKDPPCVPPGQARQGVTTEEWLNRHSIGDQVDDDEYVYLENYDYVYWNALPALGDGEAYVVLNDGIIVLDRETSTILSLINMLAN